MSDTPVSLLERLRLRPDGEAWQQFVALYQPLIRRWLERHGVQPADADDLVQEVLVVLVRELPTFQREDRPGAFRCWLRTITLNRLLTFRRARHRHAAAGGAVEQLAEREDPDEDLARLWGQEHDQYVARRLLQLLQPDFEPATWQAFQRLVLGGERAEVVAAALGMSVNAVYIAKSRVLSRLRQEARGLID